MVFRGTPSFPANAAGPVVRFQGLRDESLGFKASGYRFSGRFPVGLGSGFRFEGLGCGEETSGTAMV